MDPRLIGYLFNANRFLLLLLFKNDCIIMLLVYLVDICMRLHD